MRKTQQLSKSTLQRYNHHNRDSLIKQYKSFINQFENILSPQKIQELKQIYPHGILGYNLESNLVVFDQVGCIRSNELSKVIQDQQLYGYTMQRLIHIAEHVLEEKQKIIWIVDVGGKIMQLASKKNYALLEKIVNHSQKYFPGILHKLYFINTPMLFDTIWNRINEKIDQRTLDKITSLSDDLSELLTQVSLQLLPQYLGGNQSNQVLRSLGQKQESLKLIEKKNLEKQEMDQQNEINFDQLKMALSGLKLGGLSSNKSVAHTPLNTEADDSK